mmetsp:Transcript_1542/g.2344  ORF Transcript_1542/g.2344 Transcript_1542/m.2344 type:complete len:578 (+) Transcript_1542:306-2039(+)
MNLFGLIPSHSFPARYQRYESVQWSVEWTNFRRVNLKSTIFLQEISPNTNQNSFIKSEFIHQTRIENRSSDMDTDTITVLIPKVSMETSLLSEHTVVTEAKLKEASDPEEVCPSDRNEELEESMSDMDMVLKHLGSFVRIWVILLIHTDALPGYNHTPARLVLLGVFAWVFGILTLVGLFIENNLFTSTVRRYFGFCSVALELAYIFAALFSVGLAIASDATIAGRIAVPILLFLDTLLACVQIQMSFQYWGQHGERLAEYWGVYSGCLAVTKNGYIVAWWKNSLLIKLWGILPSCKVPFACQPGMPVYVVLLVYFFEMLTSSIFFILSYDVSVVFIVPTAFATFQVILYVLKRELPSTLTICTDFFGFWVDVVYGVFLISVLLFYLGNRYIKLAEVTILIVLVLPMPLLGYCRGEFLHETSTRRKVVYASFAMSLLALGLVLSTESTPDPHYHYHYIGRSTWTNILCYIGVGCSLISSGFCAFIVNAPWSSFIIKDSRSFNTGWTGKFLCFSNFILGVLCIGWWVFLGATRPRMSQFNTYVFGCTSFVISYLVWRAIRSLNCFFCGEQEELETSDL